MRYKRDFLCLLFSAALVQLSVISPSLQEEEERGEGEANETLALNATIEESNALAREIEVVNPEHDIDNAHARINTLHEIIALAHGSEPVDEEHDNAHVVVLGRGDPFSVLATDNETGCMYLGEKQIPPRLNGKLTFGENCEPNEVEDPSRKCKLYITAQKDKRGYETCLKATHLVCDRFTRKCACGNEGKVIPAVRFQFGNYGGHNLSDGICFIRPTFDFIPGFECSPGTEKLTIAVEEEAEATPICGCKSQADIDKFDTSDELWWLCGMASSLSSFHYSLLLLTTVVCIKAASSA